VSSSSCPHPSAHKMKGQGSYQRLLTEQPTVDRDVKLSRLGSFGIARTQGFGSDDDVNMNDEVQKLKQINLTLTPTTMRPSAKLVSAAVLAKESALENSKRRKWERKNDEY
jgi:hypothetical protein